jgi:inosine-uridine nucleoside N-ribohydrolase
VTVCAGGPEPEQLRHVDVLAGIGPWTNVAAIADAHALPRRVVMMGGALVAVRHHDEWRHIEHNLGRDPAAARRLLETTGDLTIVPLDATAPLEVGDRDEAVLVDAIPMLADQLAAWRVRHERHVALVLHDPATVLIAIGEQIARMETRRLHVDDDGTMRASISGPPQRVVAHIDANAMRARVRALASEG